MRSFGAGIEQEFAEITEILEGGRNLHLRSLCYLLLIGLSLLPVQAAPAGKAPEYDMSTPVGPNHRRVDTVVMVKDASGKEVPKRTQYVEVGGNLNYLKDGEWKRSEEKIVPHPRGAAALEGAYQVIFAKTINQEGAIEVTQPDGQKISSHPLALYYFDRSTAKSVRLSGMKDSVGEIIPPNKVIYRNAFESIRADIIYVYKMGRFEADVVLRERPAAPESFGLDNDTTVLEMATEFITAQSPQRKERVLKREQDTEKRLRMAVPDITDEEVEFSSSKIVLGTAFSLRENGERGKEAIKIGKRWRVEGKRQILSEQVDYHAIAALTAALLPASRGNHATEDGPRVWPATPGKGSANSAMSLREAEPAEKGVILDWPEQIDYGYSSYTFSASTTYEIIGDLWITGSLTFGTGAVLKYDAGKSITLAESATCSGSGPILTARDDDSVGSPCQYSTGTPSGTYASTALLLYDLDYSGFSLANLTVRYALGAVTIDSLLESSVNYFSNAEIASCTGGFTAGDDVVVIYTSGTRMCDVGTPIYPNNTDHFPNGYTSCPIMNTITNQTINEDETLFANFTLWEGVRALNPYGFTATSSNTNLVPNHQINFGIQWNSPMVIATPTANQSGTTTITVSYTGANSITVSNSFVLTVNAVNDPPSITPVGNRFTVVGESAMQITFLVDDVESGANNVTLSASVSGSSPSGLLQSQNITFDTQTGSTRVATITPAPDLAGSATVTINAHTTGGGDTDVTFTYTVKPDTADPDGGGTEAETPGASVEFGYGAYGFGGGNCTTGNCGGGEDPLVFCKKFQADSLQNVTVGTLDTCETTYVPGYLVEKNGQVFGAGGNGLYSSSYTSWGRKTIPLPGGPGCSSCVWDVEVTTVGSVSAMAGPLNVPANQGGVPIHQASYAVGDFGVTRPWPYGDPEGPPLPECSTLAMSGTGIVRMFSDRSVDFLIEGFRNKDVSATIKSARVVRVAVVEDTFPNKCFAGECEAMGLARLSSVDMSLFGGRTAYGRDRLRMGVHELLPNCEMATTSRLKLYRPDYGDPTVQVVRDGSNYVRQVKTPSMLIDVTTTNQFKYCVSYYGLGALGNGGNLTNGLFVVTNGAAPIRCFEVFNPNASTNNVNCLKMVENPDGSALTSQYDYVAAAGGNPAYWQLAKGNNLMFHRLEMSTNGAVRTETRTIRTNSSSGSPIRKKHEKLQTFAWGESLVEKSIDPGGTDERKATYDYYTSTNDYGYGKLKDVTFPNGNWQHIEYNSSNRVSRILSGYQNQGYTTNTNLCRVVAYSYLTNSGSGDAGAYRPQLPRQETEYLLGQEVSRKYFVYKKGEKREIVCTGVGAAWDNSSNLVTITKRMTNGFFKYDLRSVFRPDGTLELYDYFTNASLKITTNWVGKPGDAANTNVIAGTKTITTVGLAGQMMTNQVYDIASDILIDQQIYSDYDEELRPTKVTYLDGTFTQTSFGCCGPDNFTDRDGIMTTYAYDELKRKTNETRLGISFGYVYDAAGQTIKTTRTGTNGTTIVLHQAGYDLAGRLIAETNAVGVVTTYGYSTNSDGMNLKSTTNAVGTASEATRIELYAKDGSLLKVTGTGVVSPMRYTNGVEQVSGVYRKYTAEIKLDANGADIGERKTNYFDLAGRVFKTVYPDGAAEQKIYNTAGQLMREIDADGVSITHSYDAKGERHYTVLDINQDGVADFNGTDRITVSEQDVLSSQGTYVRRSRSFDYPITNDGATSNELSRTEMSVDGLKSWATRFGLVSSSVKTVPTNGIWSVTNIAADSSKVIAQYQEGRLISETRKDSTGTQLGQMTNAFDAHGRRLAVTDARNGATTYGYDDADRVVITTTPVPGSGQSTQTTTNHYDGAGRISQIDLPDSTSVFNEYYANGLLKTTYGSRQYPVEYSYDSQGRMLTMKTWKDFSNNTGTAVTTWNYDTNRGWLNSKRDANNQGCNYFYSAAGRLLGRLWARGSPRIATTNTYTTAGELASVAYSDSTPGVTFSYDRRGRQISCARNSITTTRYFSDSGLLLGEAYSGGTLGGMAITNFYDSLLRRTNVTAKNGATVLSVAGYSYDNASRMATASDGTYSSSYTYVDNSPLVGQIDFKQSGATRMRTTKEYDYLNRLSSITSTSASPILSFTYEYNSGNQRIKTTLADGSYWVYTYDSLGQVITGNRYWADNTPVAGQQNQYNFDDIGNRTTAKFGGDANGTNLLSASYTANSLNQYTSRTVPSGLAILGTANTNATVTVNDVSTYRKGEYFHLPLTLTNATAAVWQSITVKASRGGNTNTVTGNTFLAQTPESFTHDLDGNQTVDGRWNYTWDGENRLISAVANTAVGPQQRIEFEYDSQSRRIGKKVWNNTAGTGSPAKTLKFLYDGWNYIAEVDGNNALIQSYLWGLDLSGSLQGAGGVGGMIAVRPSGGPGHFAVFDGNGNVAGLVDGSTGIVSARYEYGPFGEPITMTGPMAIANPCRWSGKYTDDETGFVYYGYRYLDALTGRWLNRDPFEEKGGAPLYSFVLNRPNLLIDKLGLDVDSVNFPVWNCSGATVKPIVFSPQLPDVNLGAISAWQSLKVSGVTSYRSCTTCCPSTGQKANVKIISMGGEVNYTISIQSGGFKASVTLFGDEYSVRSWWGAQGGLGASGSYQFRGRSSEDCPGLDRTQPVCVTLSGKGFLHGGAEASLRLGDGLTFDVGAALGGQAEVAGQACFQMRSNGDMAYDSSKFCLSGGFYLRLRFYGEVNFDLWSGTKCW